MKQLFNNNNKKKKAFTLIELLVVIAIIGVLSGAVIVAMSGTQESAIDSRIKASMAQLRSSIEIYGLLHGSNYAGLESDSEISLLIDDIESQVGTPTVNISGSGDRYCLSTNLKSSNEKWCIDSSGYGGLGDCINYSCDRSSGYSSGGIPISTGLVGYWTMDEDSLLSSNTIRDYSPYGNTGTIYGATFTTDRKGQANKAMSFDGVDDYIDCGNNSSLNLQNSLSISLWVKRNVTNTQQTIAQHWYGFSKDESQWFLDFRGTSRNRIHGYLYGYDNSLLQFTGNTDIDTNWHHIVLTWDKEYVKIYLDSISDMTPIAFSTILKSSTVETLLGYSTKNPSLTGSIDDVRIYNRALSAEEIAFLYNSSR